MEPRKIIIIDSKNQSQKVIANSTATTLGELKREMRERAKKSKIEPVDK